MATPVSQPITDPATQKFVDESIRSLADKAAGVFAIIPQFLAAAQGKGLSAFLGTDDATLFRSTPWEASDFAATFVGGPQPVVDSDSSGRSLLTNVDVLGLIRLVQWLQTSMSADPTIQPLVAKIAVNPRA